MSRRPRPDYLRTFLALVAVCAVAVGVGILMVLTVLPTAFADSALQWGRGSDAGLVALISATLTVLVVVTGFATGWLPFRRSYDDRANTRTYGGDNAH